MKISLDEVSGGFDQFKGRGPSTYKDEVYSTALDMSKISEETKKKGIELESVIIKEKT